MKPLPTLFTKKPYRGIIQRVADKHNVSRDFARNAWSYSLMKMYLTDEEKSIVDSFKREIAKAERK